MRFKEKEGITLIALVVTIIVLIILAGVSINLLFGQYGVVTKAKDAKEKQEIAQVKEDIQLKLVGLQVEKIKKGESITTGELEEIINTSEGEVVKDASGEITGVKVGDTTIPIEEVTQGITIGDGSSTVKKDANGVEEGKSGYLGSTYNDPYIPVGFTHIGTADWNSGYQIQETATGNTFVWVPCVSNESQIQENDNVQIFKKTLPSTTATTDPYYKYNEWNLAITGDESSANAIEISVGTYGGFYIAAYEAGVPLAENGTEIAPTSATTSQKARSVAGAIVWTDITRTDALTVAESMVNTTDGVQSGLISGKCWDTTLQWMVNSSANKTANAGYDTNSSGNGWYSVVSKNAKTTTGQYPINNIYDMAGNVWEWTTENCIPYGYNYLVVRGGAFGDSGSVFPAAYRSNRIVEACKDFFIGFRVVLYK